MADSLVVLAVVEFTVVLAAASLVVAVESTSPSLPAVAVAGLASKAPAIAGTGVRLLRARLTAARTTNKLPNTLLRPSSRSLVFAPQFAPNVPFASSEDLPRPAPSMATVTAPKGAASTGASMNTSAKSPRTVKSVSTGNFVE